MYVDSPRRCPVISSGRGADLIFGYQQNLKAWSLAEKQRRAKSRTSSSSITLPSAPSINVLGRSATLFRQVSTRVRGNSVGSDELSGGGRDRARDRRDRRTSVAIPETREESFDGFLKDGCFSPTVASPVTPSSPPPASIAGVTSRYSNPFSSPRSSTANRPRSDSNLTETPFDPPRPLSMTPTINSSTTTLERASRFIEDLPTQAVGTSRPNSSSLDPLVLSKSSAILNLTDPEPTSTEFGFAPTNPFIDGFQMVESDRSRDRSNSLLSSTSSGGMTTASEGTIMAHNDDTSPFGNDHRESRPTAHPNGGDDTMGDYELRTSSAGWEARERFENQAHQRALLEEEEGGEIGVLEWMMCGCWGRDTRDDRENSGRTNPNE